jgi:tRNA (guanine37-N1)-methyltransferase
MASYDILGNIAILKFPENTSKAEKEKKALEIMNHYKGVKTILEKIEKVSGRLRTIKTAHILGEETLIADYRENGCRFKLNVETCYFSPRLANERIEIARMISKIKNPRVLVMFSGVDPFSIVIAKNSNAKKITSIELGKDCEKYANQNIILNKVFGLIEHIQGDVKKIIPKLVKSKEKFDIVVMPRPNLKETFFTDALKVSKKNTLIIYYGFSPETKKEEMILNLEKEAKKSKRKIKIFQVKEAGDIAPYEHRYRIEIKVLK